ncbi:MAG: ABC transporter ATP-binding protein [Luteibaculaceae bacterium]
MIEVKNLNKSFNGTQVLKDVSFTFLKGKTNIIIGQSGSGKTVLTKCIVGLFEIDSGSVNYDDVNYFDLSVKERRNLRKQVGMLFQGGALFDSLNIAQNVAFPLRMFGEMTKKEIDERVNFCLQRVKLVGKNHLFPAEISGGMKKRVAIARAIALNPKYLFCDEPNSGLDPETSIVIDKLIKEITHEYDITTIVITHDMNSVIEIGENICFIKNGTVDWQGDRKSILRTNNENINSFVFASEFMQEVKANLNPGT